MTDPTTPENPVVPPVEKPDAPKTGPDATPTPAPMDNEAFEMKTNETWSAIQNLHIQIGFNIGKYEFSEADVIDMQQKTKKVEDLSKELKALLPAATPDQQKIINDLLKEAQPIAEEAKEQMAEIEATVEAAAMKKAEEELEKSGSSGEPGGPGAPGAAGAPTEKPSRMDRITESLGKGFEKMMEFFAKMGETFGAALDKMGMNAKGVLKFAEAIGFKWLAEAVRPKVEVIDAHAAIEKVFGKENVVKNKEDHDAVRTLKEQYASLLDGEKDKPGGKTSSNYSFETFLKEKAENIKAGGKTECSIEDLAGGKTAVDAQREKEAEEKRKEEEDKKEKEEKETKKKEEEEKAKKEKEEAEKKTQERLKTDPDARNAAYLVSLGRAMKLMGAAIPLDEAALQKDIDGSKAATDAFAYKKLAKDITDWLGTENNGETVFGLELDGGDLEESDGTNLAWDNDILVNFDLINSPISTIDRLLGIQLNESDTELKDGTNINATAHKQIPELQRRIQAEIAKYPGLKG